MTEKKEKVKIRITKDGGASGGNRPSDIDAPVIDDIAKKFDGKVTGGYKGGEKQSEIDGEIVLPPGVDKIEIEKKK